MTASIEPFGELALRVRFDGSLDEAGRCARALAEAIRAGDFDEVADVANGARTVLLDLQQEPGPRLRRLLDDPPSISEGPAGPLHELEIEYDGEDLDEIAAESGLSRTEVVRLHASAEYTVAFLGFSPGFPYLFGTPEPLAALSRRKTPRTAVPAGSVAVAGGWTGIYPARTPGGWRLLGQTEAVLFDPGRPSPTLLAPGDRVRFLPR